MKGEKSTDRVSSGVESLIERLRDEGVARGQEEAGRIVQDAEARARWILRQAEEEAARLRTDAQAEADRLTRSAREALRVAVRDAILSLKAELSRRFAHELTRLIGSEMAKEEFLRALILEVAGPAVERARAAARVEILLPRDVVGFEELSRNPAELTNGRLTRFTKLVAADLLRAGISFGANEGSPGGLQLRLVDEGIVLDLSEETVAAILLAHLQPRFRALVEGIVR